MLQMYKGFYISGTAGMVHPFSPESYPAGKIYKPGRAGSIEEVTSSHCTFKMTDQDLAAFFGLELAKMVVDEWLSTYPQARCEGAGRGLAPWYLFSPKTVQSFNLNP